jgi:hypothetical protein
LDARGQRGFRVSSVVAPEATAALADSLFFTPPRRHPQPREQAVLEDGHEFELEVRGDTVHGWSRGAGPTVLLCHGWGGHSGQLIAFVPALVGGLSRGGGRHARTRTLGWTQLVARALRRDAALGGRGSTAIARRRGAAARPESAQNFEREQ